MLDYQYFEDDEQLIAVDLSKQKELDADPRTILQSEFYGMLKSKSHVCTNLEKAKKNGTEILRRNSKGCVMSKYKYSKVNFKGGLSGRMTY